MNAARWLAGAACGLLALVAGSLASGEARARLDRLPFAVLRLARTRLPAELREPVHDREWLPELEHILKHAELYPLTRLLAGLRYAAGLLMRASTVAAELQPADSARAPEPRRLAARSAGVLQALIWPVREPVRVRLYVTAIAAVSAAATGAAAASTTVHARDVELFAILMVSGLAAHRLPVRARAGIKLDLMGVWLLPIAVLLPPVYVLISPAPFFALDQCRLRSCPVYRRVFSTAANGLAYGAASELARTTAPPAAGHSIPPGADLLTWTGLTGACGLLAAAGIAAFLLAAVKTTTPSARVLPLVITRAVVRYGMAGLALGIAVTVAAAAYPLLAIAVIPAAILLSLYLETRTPTPSATS